MSDRLRVEASFRWTAILIGTVVVAVIVGSCTAGYMLYTTAREQMLSHLGHSVERYAGLLRAVAAFDREHSDRDHPGGSRGATLAQAGAAERFHEVEAFEDASLVAERLPDGSYRILAGSRQLGASGSVLGPDAWLLAPLNAAWSSGAAAGEFADPQDETQLVACRFVPEVACIVLFSHPLAAISRPFVHSAAGAIAITVALMAAAVGVVLRTSLPIVRGMSAQAEEIEAKNLHLERAAAESRESRDFIENLINATPDLIYVYDLVERRNVFSNDAIQSILGYTAEAVQEMGEEFLSTVMHPDDYSNYLENIVRRYATAVDGELIEHQYRMRDRQGEMHWLLSKEMVHRRAADGSPERILGIVTDITEFRRVQSQLAQREATFRVTFEQAPIGIAHVAPDETWLRVNPTLCRILGYTEDELRGVSFRELSHPQDIDASLSQMQRVLRGEMDSYSLEKRYVRRDGQVVWALMTSALVRDEEGNPDFFVSITQDITERKALEGALAAQTAELRRSNNDLQQFAYVASHDLQEPLRMVSSYVQLLAKRYSGKLGEDADDFIGYAVDGATRMQSLIHGLLQFSRVNTQGKPFEKLELDSLISRVLQDLQGQIEESGAVVEVEELGCLMGDAGQVQQLFQNLISNALKFHQPGKPPRVRVWRSGEKGERVLHVSDSGIGVAPDHRERIFLMFQRLHGRDEYPGSGIGLALCKRIVDRHGGRIWLDSSAGQGATFNVVFDTDCEDQ